MSNFVEMIKEVLIEKNKSLIDLEDSRVLGKNTFYIYSNSMPSLRTALKICNFLEVSIDYLLDKSNEVNFKKYDLMNIGFYQNLNRLMNFYQISQYKICFDIGISRTNFSRWKNGTLPSLEILEKISQYLNCSIDELLNHEV
ncbi:MAG: helix-turn-helix domain-containing protein [Clostridia bacterium]|jgi:transcriptional regulator with XRE-family HTH domain|nr:helix-turn-helix domain-containing protein [Clostridia bacterium]